MKWLTIIGLAVLYSFNAFYTFLSPEKSTKYRGFAMIVAFILVGHFIASEILKYINYSYALISENGQIIEKTNFKYDVIFIDNESPEYIIVGLKDPKNLNIQPYKAVSAKLSEVNEGLKVQFISSGWGSSMVASRFKIEQHK